MGTAVRPLASPMSSVQWTERHCKWLPVCAVAEVLLEGRSWAARRRGEGEVNHAGNTNHPKCWLCWLSPPPPQGHSSSWAQVSLRLAGQHWVGGPRDTGGHLGQLLVSCLSPLQDSRWLTT